MAEQDGDIPFYLMPIAAIFGVYTLVGGFRLLYLVYVNVTYNNKKDSSSLPPLVRLQSRPFAVLVATVTASILIYGTIVARVENAVSKSEHALFDPYDILGVIEDDSAEIKKAYRSLAMEHHPDKGGDPKRFQRINNAYRALTDSQGRRNYELYGHPDGPVHSPALSFAMPGWLLHPQGNVAIAMILLYLAMFAAIVYLVIQWTSKTETKKKGMDTSVAGADAAYLISQLSPTSTHIDVLFCIATTPENVLLTQQHMDKVQKMRAKKIAKLEQAATKSNKTSAFDDQLLNDEGWAQDDDDDDEAKAAAQKAKEEEEIKAKQRKQLAEASGDGDVPMEGIDPEVLGQEWVESILTSKNFWPIGDLRTLEDKTFHLAGKEVTALDHPAVKRNLLMTIGRLNSVLLNSHPDLLEASSKGLIDQTYFRFNMEYRQRAGLLLEACLRVAMSMQSYRLTKTIVETVAMFKIGVTEPSSQKSVDWFNNLMKRQYGPTGLPRLKITNIRLETPGEKEVATGDVSAIFMDLERMHAESFTKVKIAMCQKQGIPPQVALQTYREGWWLLLRAKKMDGDDNDEPVPLQIPASPLTKMLSDADREKFEKEVGENRLLTGWPMIVQNMAQQTGKAKVQFKAPSVPGKYKFFIEVKSQDFLGADQSLQLEAEIKDAEEVKRKEEEEQKDDNEAPAEEDESKKEK